MPRQGSNRFDATRNRGDVARSGDAPAQRQLGHTIAVGAPGAPRRTPAAVEVSAAETDVDLVGVDARPGLETEDVFSAESERKVCRMVLGDRAHGL